jgi:hypothetical protein
MEGTDNIYKSYHDCRVVGHKNDSLIRQADFQGKRIFPKGAI